MSTGRPSQHIYGKQTYGIAWRGAPKGHSSSAMAPALAAKVPRSAVVFGLGWLLYSWHLNNKMHREQLDEDLPYLRKGNEALSVGAAKPSTGTHNLSAFPQDPEISEKELESEKRVTKAVSPLYPLGHNVGGDGPSDDPDVSHMGLQMGFHNVYDFETKITDLEKLEHPVKQPKGYSFQKMADANFYDDVGLHHETIMKMQFHTPCAELFADLRMCEQKFGWRAHHSNRRAIHKHENACSPEFRKYHRCMDALKERNKRLHALRNRQAMGEQVGLKSDPLPGEKRSLLANAPGDHTSFMTQNHAETVKTFFKRHGRNRHAMYDYEDERPQWGSKEERQAERDAAAAAAEEKTQEQSS